MRSAGVDTLERGTGAVVAARPLRLLREAKVVDLLHEPLDERLEASGVCVKDGLLHVIFDNCRKIARLSADLSPDAGENVLLHPGGGRDTGFEDITFDRWSNRFYVLIEAVELGGGTFMAVVQEHDHAGRFLSSARLDFPLPRPNKGLEGLTCIRRGDETFLLGLCEGNRCRAGAAGRKPGGGRIQVFTRGRSHWDHVATVKLPKSVRFEDYASLAVSGDRVAVVSQASSRMWLSTFDPSTWTFGPTGTVYDFPRDRDGRACYCNVEGVTWLGDDLVVVSDRAKRGAQPKRCREKEQSVHVFSTAASE